MVLGGRVRGRAVGKVDGVLGVDGQSRGVVVDGSGVVLLRHGGVSFGLEGFGFLLLLLGRLGAGRGSASSGIARGVLELLVEGIDLVEGLAVGGRGGRVNLEGLGYAVHGNVDGLGVLGCEGSIAGRRCEEVADGERETLLGCERRLISKKANVSFQYVSASE